MRATVFALSLFPARLACLLRDAHPLSQAFPATDVKKVSRNEEKRTYYFET